MEGIQTLKVSWPWPWPSIRPYGMSSCISHRPLPIYQISFKLKKLFVDGRTYGWTDIFPLYIIRSTLGSRPNNTKYKQSLHQIWTLWEFIYQISTLKDLQTLQGALVLDLWHFLSNFFFFLYWQNDTSKINTNCVYISDPSCMDEDHGRPMVNRESANIFDFMDSQLFITQN